MIELILLVHNHTGNEMKPNAPSIICGNLRIFGGTADERHSLTEKVRTLTKTMQGEELITQARIASHNTNAFCVLMTD